MACGRKRNGGVAERLRDGRRAKEGGESGKALRGRRRGGKALGKRGHEGG